MSHATITPSLSIDNLKFKKASKVFRSVNHKLRQRMLNLIHENGKISVKSIYVVLKIEQSVASQHLAILRREGFVHTERDGKFIFYTVNYQRLKEVHRLADELID